MSMGKRPRKGGAEEDAFCIICRKHHSNKGRSLIKRMARRRERRQARQSDHEG